MKRIDHPVNLNDLANLPADGVVIADIRDGAAYLYGHIPGAINIPAEQLADHPFAADKRVVLYCRTGQLSAAAAEQLRGRDIDACYLEGGYLAWLQRQADNLSPQTAAAVEQGIQTVFRKRLFTKFVKAINQYRLLQSGDKVAVCISGGKDSMLMAKLFQELQRHSKFEFGLEFLVMDPGYSEFNLRLIQRNASALGIPITVFQTDIFDSVFSVNKSPCYLCARMRRGHLYAQAQKLGCNKIALGHHYDDVIETTLMGMLYGAQMQTMMPRVDSANFKGMQLIRPMYLIREDDIKAWRDCYNLHFIQCACKFTENFSADACRANGDMGSKRLKVKQLIRQLSAQDPEIEQNIFKSSQNVNLSTVIAYKDKNGVKHYYWDDDGDVQ